MKLKHIFSFLLCVLALNAGAQSIDSKFYTEIVPPYSWRSGWFKTNLNIPKVTATTGRDSGAIRYNISDSSIYVWTGFQWRKVNDGASSDSSIFATRHWTTQNFRPITWVPTLQEVTDAGNTTSNDITISNLFLNGDAISAIGGSLNLVLGNSNFAIQSDTNIYQNSPTIRFKHSTQRGFTLPNKSGTFILDTDTSSMLSPYLPSNVAAATYQPIGSYLTSVPTLQEVTDAGNTTNNDITIGNLFLNGDAIVIMLLINMVRVILNST